MKDLFLSQFSGLVASADRDLATPALMIARLDDVARRCREGVPDIRAEIAALKAQALVQGLTKGEEDDFEREVRDVVLRASAARTVLRSSAVPRGPAPRALPSGD